MPTPILERERPVPDKLQSNRGQRILNFTSAVIGMLLVFGNFGPLPLLREWILGYLDRSATQITEAGVIGIVLAMGAAYYAFIAIHEVGHLVAGKLAGFRFRSIRVGPVILRFPFEVARSRMPGTFFNGAAEMLPVRMDHLSWRGIVFALGGPIANLITAIVLFSLPSANLFAGDLLFFSVIGFIGNLLPLQTRVGTTDGGRIAMLLRSDGRGQRWLALLRLNSDYTAGVVTGQEHGAFVRLATRIRDGSPDTVVAHLFGFQHLSHEGRHDEAGQYLEVCLEYAAHVPPLMREALKSEAAVHLARRRHMPDRAADWLPELPYRKTHPWIRDRVEAAILTARGDRPGALAKLRDVEAATASLPSGGPRQLAYEEVRNWRAELESPAAALT